MIILVFLILLCLVLGRLHLPLLYYPVIKRFQKEELTEFPPSEGIVFTGSSLIGFWKSLSRDMAPFPVLNRGIPGAKIREVTAWTGDTVLPWKPRAVVLYAGSNDLQGPFPASPHNVLKGFQEFEKKTEGIPLFYIAITPSASFLRWKHRERVFKANVLIKEYCESRPGLCFIDTSSGFLKEGIPDRTLFKKDTIHLSEKGYGVWQKAIKDSFVKEGVVSGGVYD